MTDALIQELLSTISGIESRLTIQEKMLETRLSSMQTELNALSTQSQSLRDMEIKRATREERLFEDIKSLMDLPSRVETLERKHERPEPSEEEQGYRKAAIAQMMDNANFKILCFTAVLIAGLLSTAIRFDDIRGYLPQLGAQPTHQAPPPEFPTPPDPVALDPEFGLEL